MRKLYLLVDAEDYEPTTVIAAYLDRKQADEECRRLRAAAAEWLSEQERMDAAGDARAWISQSPPAHTEVRDVELRDEQPVVGHALFPPWNIPRERT